MKIKPFILAFAGLGLSGCGGGGSSDKIAEVLGTWEVNCTTNEIRRIGSDTGTAFLNKNKWYSKEGFVEAAMDSKAKGDNIATSMNYNEKLARKQFNDLKNYGRCN